MRLFDLKTMHQKQPVTDQTPYFSWKIDSARKNVLQDAYRIQVALGDEVFWDSGKVISAEQSFVEYQGKKLASRGCYIWKVTVWDNQGEEASAEECFETAFMDAADWRARWAECPFRREPASGYKFGNTYPPVLFEKEFKVEKEVKSARLYATCHGVYRPLLNGRRLDEREFAPEYTPYHKILYYQTYPVTGLLEQGVNRLSLYVGDGWYFSAQAMPVMPDSDRHGEPSVLFQLEIAYEDGTEELVISDGDVTCRTDYIIYSDLYQGEKQDYRLTGKGAVCQRSDDSVKAEVREYGYNFLCAQPMPPVFQVKLIPATGVFTSPAGETIVDFGQILAGRARVYINVPKGREVTLEYFEVLDEKGNYMNTMFAPQKDIVISNGEAIEHEAVFTFHGFRYIRVTGMDEVRKEDFTAVLLSTVKENRGSFQCSDKRLNRLYKNIRYSQYNNMMSIPTDCPSREKAGWTGDILIYTRTALINEEMTPFLGSWLHSLRAGQAADGTVMIVAPYMKLYENLLLQTVKRFGDDKPTGVAGWSDAIVWVPYEMYQVTGNKLILRDNFEAMERWCGYIIKTAAEKRGYQDIGDILDTTDTLDNGDILDIPEEYDRYLWNTGFHFGEWLVPSRPDNTGEQYGICRESAYYIAPFFGYMTLHKMAEICRVLGKEKEAAEYAEISEKMKAAIQQGIFRRNLMPEHLMGAYVLAFAFDLVPEELQEEYKERLLNLIRKNGNCLDTGFLATPYLLDALCGLGKRDLAAEILWQDKRPSWLYEVDQGATAIWEAWDADEARKTGRFVSFDHYAFGCVDDWICRHIAGIYSDTPGFRHVWIAPEIDGRLKSCRRSFESEAGTICADWNEERLEVTIPCNATATVVWRGRKHELGSGRYEFS